MASYNDQTGRTITLNAAPQRIVSLVPSLTELLYVLALEREVVGITKFCVHPEEWRAQKEIVGGTKKLHLERIAALRPDLIVANQEENTKEDVEWLLARFPVWVSDVRDLRSATEMIRQLGELTHRKEKAHTLADTIDYLLQKPPVRPRQKALYLIWRKPWMAAGTDSYIHHVMHWAGYDNVLAAEQGRYPTLSDEEIKALHPDTVLLSSEPYPFNFGHRVELRSLMPQANIEMVDGELFSWYGPKMLEMVGVMGK
jgi:ABC-type Fe3+-hydroxamate transport system substrate-binding protein